MHKVFISYRRKTAAAHARELKTYLDTVLGRGSVFLDRDTRGGTAWWDGIRRAIADAGVVLVLVSPDWATLSGADGRPRLLDPEDWTRREIELALAGGAHVYPVLLGGASMPPADALPASLRRITTLQASRFSEETPRVDLERIARHVTELLASGGRVSALGLTTRKLVRSRLLWAGVVAAAAILIFAFVQARTADAPDCRTIAASELADKLADHYEAYTSAMLSGLQAPLALAFAWMQTPEAAARPAWGQGLGVPGEAPLSPLFCMDVLRRTGADPSTAITAEQIASMASMLIGEADGGGLGDLDAGRFGGVCSPDPAFGSLAEWLQAYERRPPSDEALERLGLHEGGKPSAELAALAKLRATELSVTDAILLATTKVIARKDAALIRIWIETRPVKDDEEHLRVGQLLIQTTLQRAREALERRFVVYRQAVEASWQELRRGGP